MKTILIGRKARRGHSGRRPASGAPSLPGPPAPLPAPCCRHGATLQAQQGGVLRWWLWQDSGLGGQQIWLSGEVQPLTVWPGRGPASAGQAAPRPAGPPTASGHRLSLSLRCRHIRAVSKAPTAPTAARAPGTSWEEEEGKEEEHAFVVRLASLEAAALALPHPRHSRAMSSEPTDRVTRVPAQMRG